VSLTQLSAWRKAVEAEPKVPVRELREVEFDLHCRCGTIFKNLSVESFPESCLVCGAGLGEMRARRTRKTRART
jgi:hypothetical protein